MRVRAAAAAALAAEEIGDLLPYGGPATLASLAWTGFRNGDYAIIGATLGAAQAGFYWRAYQLAVEYQKKISAVMSQMAFPVLARTAGKEEMLALRRRMVQMLTVILFPLLALLVLLAPEHDPVAVRPALGAGRRCRRRSSPPAARRRW